MVKTEFTYNGKNYISCEYSRGGTHSPTLEIIYENGIQLTPFKQRLIGWKWTFGFGLAKHYPLDLMRDMIYRPNPLLTLMPKNSDWKGGTVLIPFKFEK